MWWSFLFTYILFLNLNHIPAFNERVLSTTQDEILPAVNDTILQSNLLAMRLIWGRPKTWVGETLRRPVKISKSTTGGAFSGLATFDTTAVNNTVRMSWNPTGYYQSVTIPGIEKAVNATTARVIDMVAVAMESASHDMADSIGDIFYGTSDGTGDEFTGLRSIILDSGSIGGQSRTTYPSLASTVTASGGTMTLNKISTLISNVSLGGNTKQRPSYLVGNETIFDLFESLLTPTVRHNYGVMPARGPMLKEGAMGNTAEQGFSAIVYKGIPMVADEKATSQTLYAINENHLEFFVLKSPDLKSINMSSKVVKGGPYDDGEEVGSKSAAMQWTGFKVPTNQFGEVGQLILLGNLVSFNPARHGRLTGITGV